jgi:ribosomal protein S12 methylthiotransferase accessory factor
MNLEKILSLLYEIGLTEQEEEITLITDEPKIPTYLCFPNNIAAPKYNTREVFGQGIDLNRKKAQIKAIAECLERLCLFNPVQNFITAEFKEGESFVDPTLFFCYSDEQVPNKEEVLKEIKRGIYRWMPVINLKDNKKYLIPAQLVFLSSIFDDELQIRKERISTGTAFGMVSTNYALKEGFMECVERDACISSYLKKRSLRKIVDFPSRIQNLVDYLQRYQLEPFIFDAASDLNIPTVLVITLDRTGIGPAINIGSKSSTNYKDAIEYALLESIHCRRQARIMKNFYFPEKFPTESEINCMDSRFYYWYSVDRINDLNFWLESKQFVKYKDLKQKNLTFEQALHMITENHHFNVFVADITLPEIKEKGFEVLKVVIPELHPLYLDENAKALYSIHYGQIKEDKTLKPHPFT